MKRVLPRLALALCLLVFSLRAVTSMVQDSATWDETHYFALGKYLLQHFTWDVSGSILHPPLSYYIHSIPLLFVPTDPTVWHPVPPGDSRLDLLAGVDGSDTIRGQILLSSPLNRDDRLLTLSRLMMVSTALLLGCFVYLWSCSLYGAKSAVFAAVLCSCCPNILAHARLITPDIVLATFSTPHPVLPVVAVAISAAVVLPCSGGRAWGCRFFRSSPARFSSPSASPRRSVVDEGGEAEPLASHLLLRRRVLGLGPRLRTGLDTLFPGDSLPAGARSARAPELPLGNVLGLGMVVLHHRVLSPEDPAGRSRVPGRLERRIRQQSAKTRVERRGIPLGAGDRDGRILQLQPSCDRSALRSSDLPLLYVFASRAFNP